MDITAIIPYDGCPEFHSDVTRLLRGLLETLDRHVRVIEIGTAYGAHLGMLSGCQASLVSIDPMYDWVPDVRPDVRFDPSLVDGTKVASWHTNNVIGASLLIGKSSDIARDPAHLPLLGGSTVLLIDGCHHPAQAVISDYDDFEAFMDDEHFVIFDDINHSDPGIAAEAVEERLRGQGHHVDRQDFFSGHMRLLHVRRKRT